MSAPQISAIVPVFNEAESLARAMQVLTETLDRLCRSWEMVIVESGSSDSTADLCDSHAAADTRIRVIHEGARNGFGAAIIRGIAASNGERLWIVPVDLPFPPETLERALALDADAVVSFRSSDPRSLARRTQSAAFNALARRLLGIKVRSVNSAFKLYRRAAVADLPLRSRGWLIDAELLASLTARGASIVEIPVALVERQSGESKVGALDGFRVLWQLIELRRMMGRGDA